MLSAYHIDVYDFVAERGGRFIRVNVKLATEDPVRSPRISRPGRTSAAGDPDLYLVFVRSKNQFVQLPGAFLKGKKSRRFNSTHYVSLL